jgi:hypothetical protein
MPGGGALAKVIARRYWANDHEIQQLTTTTTTTTTTTIKHKIRTRLQQRRPGSHDPSRQGGTAKE